MVCRLSEPVHYWDNVGSLSNGPLGMDVREIQMKNTPAYIQGIKSKASPTK